MTASNYVKKIYGFQDDILKIYARLWQFETWLRRMIYVELRAKRGDEWSNGLDLKMEAFETDKALTHMGTPELNAFSYTELWRLLKIVENHWDCFDKYFPPIKLWKAKTHEISQIRNRVAHFRTCHVDDLQRVEQFLRDIDKGFWDFCTSYNDARPVLPQSADKVTEHFMHLDPLPYSEIKPNEWVLVGQVNKSMAVGIKVNKANRPWFIANVEGQKDRGALYDISLLSFDYKFDVLRFLKSTRHIHPHLVTLDFDSHHTVVRLVLPAVLGSDKIIELVTEIEKRARNCITRSLPSDPLKNTVSEWPEYVLSSDNPLSFLSPDMPCSFFNV